MTVTLEQVLADARGELPILRKHGAGQVADAIETLCDQVSRAAEAYLTWLSEPEAAIVSGKSRDWLRHRFARWERDGHARIAPNNKRQRQYRLVILPKRYDREAVTADAIAEARRKAS